MGLYHQLRHLPAAQQNQDRQSSDQGASSLPSVEDGEAATSLAGSNADGHPWVEGAVHSPVAEGPAWDNEVLSTWRCCLLVMEEVSFRNWQIELLDPGLVSEASGTM